MERDVTAYHSKSAERSIATKRACLTQGGAETNYWPGCNKNSSGDEIANVNFYAVCQKLPEFDEITRNNGHYAVQGHSRSPILVPIESTCTISY